MYRSRKPALVLVRQSRMVRKPLGQKGKTARPVYRKHISEGVDGAMSDDTGNGRCVALYIVEFRESFRFC